MTSGLPAPAAAAPFSVIKLDPERADAVVRPILVVDAQPCPSWADFRYRPAAYHRCVEETFAIGNPHRHGLFAGSRTKSASPIRRRGTSRFVSSSTRTGRNASASITSQKLLNCAMSAAEEISPDARATASRLLSTALQVVAARAVDG